MDDDEPRKAWAWYVRFNKGNRKTKRRVERWAEGRREEQ